MKKQLLAAAFLACAGAVQSQTILNGNFENWSTISFDEPNTWFTSNREAPGFNTITKVTGFAGSAIKIETKADPDNLGDFIGGFISNTEGDPTEGEGGVPFSQQPTAITGKIMANLVGNDTALLLVVFKKNGAVTSTNIFKLNGKNQTTFTDFSFPISLSAAPDSVVIACASSNLISSEGIEVGSSITIDNLAFTGPGVTQTIPNGGFEQWTTTTQNELDGWEYFNNTETISRATDKYKGSYALKLETKDFGGGNVGSGFISNGYNSGLPYTKTVDTLIGWYKYSTPGNDSGSVGVSLAKNGMGIGGGFVFLTPKTTFTYFEIPIFVMSAPDSLRINIASSSGMNAVAGSTLIIDEVQLKSAPLNTGLNPFAKLKSFSKAYPNPATNLLTIQTIETHDLVLTIYDVTGKLVNTASFTKGQNIELNISALPAGLYTYQLQSADGYASQNKFIKE